MPCDMEWKVSATLALIVTLQNNYIIVARQLIDFASYLGKRLTKGECNLTTQIMREMKQLVFR